MGRNRAVFLDRDGVINPLVYNLNTEEYESPHYPEDFSIYTYILKSLQLLKKHGFKVILISNQPSYAKGKTSLENIREIEKLLQEFSDENGILIDKYYYCYHHPNGIVPGYSYVCDCRKPSTKFVEQSIEEFGLNRSDCYFIGDQDTDIECGKNAGLVTVKINNKDSQKKSGKVQPDFFAKNMYDAVQRILEVLNEH
ncbi:MAG: HAD-IIIA family hydrolase [Clostridiales bacterium]|jgi:D-glycero-D-manno-heptose 1,7-bisphosphate phosphatase|nr:HAD-IIIA family hydrolase [Clostridiales bacterium]